MCLRIKAFALTGRGDSTMRKTQGVASLALGYVLHWAFSPSLLNPNLNKNLHTCLLTRQPVNPLTRQPVNPLTRQPVNPLTRQPVNPLTR